jgi:hypothetical protein
MCFPQQLYGVGLSSESVVPLVEDPSKEGPIFTRFFYEQDEEFMAMVNSDKVLILS